MEDWIANPEQAVDPLLFTAGFIAGFFGMYSADHGKLMTKNKGDARGIVAGVSGGAILYGSETGNLDSHTAALLAGLTTGFGCHTVLKYIARIQG